VKNYHSSL